MFVVTLPVSATKDPRAYAERAKSAGADMLEIRGDRTPEVKAFESPLPLLIAPRGTGDRLLKILQADYVDLEMEEDVDLPDDVTAIRSFHDYEGTPTIDELRKIAKQLQDGGADLMKIATTITSYKDLVVLENLRKEMIDMPQAERLLPDSKNFPNREHAFRVRHILLGMGPKAHFSRMISPFRNALTYTYLDDGDEAAPGQVSLAMYQRTRHCKNPAIYGLLSGMQSTTSLSPLIHNTLFERHDLDALYCLFPTEDFNDAIPQIFCRGIDVQGLSVTAPYKQEAATLADRPDDAVKEIQTANTLVREKDGRWFAYNTDISGFCRGYGFLGSIDSAVIVGSGGVVPAILHGCTYSGIEPMTIVARNEKERARLAAMFDMRHAPLEDLSTLNVDLMINALPEDIEWNLPEAKADAHAIDLRYGKQSAFLAHAAKRGYTVHDGLPMLLEQALLQFEHFTGITPNEEDRRAVHAALQSSSFAAGGMPAT